MSGLRARLVAGNGLFLPSGRPSGAYSRDDLLPSGAKIRGANIISTVAQFAAGQGAGHTGPGVAFWTQWDATSTGTQLDRAAALGCNVVRTFGSVKAVINEWITRAAYLDLWEEFSDLASARGLRIYPAGESFFDPDFGVLTLQNFLDELVPWAARLHATRNCIGLDLINEGADWADWDGGANTQGRTVYLAVKAVTDLSCTYSMIGAAANMTRDVGNSDLWYCDHRDVHWYNNPTSTVIESDYWDLGRTKPFLVGEFGENVAAGQAAQETRYNAVNAAISHAGDSGRRPAGCLNWCLTDYGTNDAQRWGMFTDAGTERTYLTDIFETIPKA